MSADIDRILGYLGIDESSAEAQSILGPEDQREARRDHIAVVAAIIDRLSAARMAATGSPYRPSSAVGWLNTAIVRVPRGNITPLDMLADPDLARMWLGEDSAR